MDLLLGCSDVTVICEENGVRRPCTTNDVTKAGLCQQSEFPLSIYLFIYLPHVAFLFPLFRSLRHLLFTQKDCRGWVK